MRWLYDTRRCWLFDYGKVYPVEEVQAEGLNFRSSSNQVGLLSSSFDIHIHHWFSDRDEPVPVEFQTHQRPKV